MIREVRQYGCWLCDNYADLEHKEIWQSFVVLAKKYASEHVKTNWLKLYMDGTVESGTGFIELLYTDGHQGLVN